MSIKENIQNEMKDALRAKDQIRLDCLRMAKGAILVKEKDGSGEVTDEVTIAILRSEVKKRQKTIETLTELGKDEAVELSRNEIAILESFLPQQLSKEELTDKVRAYLADNPDINHPGRLIGAMKKDLGDLADGKVLSQVCQEALA